MEVTFCKGDGGRLCRWDAVRARRIRIPGSTMAAGGHLPHDLAQFVVESVHDVRYGFWGCVADGATFKSLGRRITKPGRTVIRLHRDELAAAEYLAGLEIQAWRKGRPGAAAAALDDMLERWRALPDGGELVLEWGGDVAGRRRRSGRSSR